MKRRRGHNYETEWNWLEAAEAFAEFDRLSLLERQRKLAEAKDKARRERNLDRALRIRPRMYRVQAFDIWAIVNNTEFDYWDWPDPRFEKVKRLYAKKAKLEWVLTQLFNYWSFDYVTPGTFTPSRKTLTYSYLCKWYDRAIIELHKKAEYDRWERQQLKLEQRDRDKGVPKEKRKIDASMKKVAHEIYALKFGTVGPILDHGAIEQLKEIV